MPALDDALHHAPVRIAHARRDGAPLSRAPDVLVARALLLLGDEEVLLWLPTEVRNKRTWEIRLDAFTDTRWVHVRQIGSPDGSYDSWAGAGPASDMSARAIALGELCRMELDSDHRIDSEACSGGYWGALVWRLGFRDGSEYRLTVRDADTKPLSDNLYSATEQAADFIASLALIVQTRSAPRD